VIDTERAAKLCALHEAAEAAGFNGVQVVAELNRTVVEQGKDWDAAYRVALRFYRREWTAAAAPTRVPTRVGALWRELWRRVRR